MSATARAARASAHSLHQIGVVSGLAAGAWLGAAEAPVKLVNTGLSPFLISSGMVAGVFVARWTVPLLLRGSGCVFDDIRQRPHLTVWALLAGALWAVANTLTVFAIREVGLAIAFPLWNTNGLIGLLWGWLLFGELSGSRQWGKVAGGSAAIAFGAYLLAYATALDGAGGAHRIGLGVGSALGAGLLWGTMYIPYRKAYISGMNPLSFVTIFTFGELGSVLTLAAAFDGGIRHFAAAFGAARPALFWLFLGGFCWVLGDLFQQYAARYIGIGRGIPLSNTNQLWGLAWGALVFGETAGMQGAARSLVLAGSVIMALGAWAISSAEAPAPERAAWQRAVERETKRYGRAAQPSGSPGRRGRLDRAIFAGALAIFAILGSLAKLPQVHVNVFWSVVLMAAALAFLAAGGMMLWKRTRFL